MSLIPFHLYCVRTSGGVIRLSATREKFLAHLEYFLILTRTHGGVPYELEVPDMSEINWSSYVVRLPNGTVDTDATVNKFEDELKAWMLEQRKDAEKYKRAIFSQFKKPDQKIPGPLLAAFAAAGMGLEATNENQNTLVSAISELIRQGILIQAKGKGGGVGIAADQWAEAERSAQALLEDEEEPEPEPPPVPVPSPSKRKLR